MVKVTLNAVILVPISMGVISTIGAIKVNRLVLFTISSGMYIFYQVLANGACNYEPCNVVDRVDEKMLASGYDKESFLRLCREQHGQRTG